jgi:hypothetical protein
VNLYLNPSITQHDVNVSPISGNGPLLASLAIFAEDHFVWGDGFGILSKFSESLLPGLAVRQLLHSAAAMFLGLSGLTCPMIKPHIHSQRTHGVHPTELRFSLKVNISASIVRNSLKGTHNKLSTPQQIDKWLQDDHCVWLPEVMVRHVFPRLVHEFNGDEVSTSSDKSLGKLDTVPDCKFLLMFICIHSRGCRN